MNQPFALAHERLDDAELRRQAAYFDDQSFAGHLLDAVPSVLLILNRQRQILYANRSLLDLVSGAQGAALRGLRPGEAFNCVHSGAVPAGCGAAFHCRACGILGTIVAGFEGDGELRDCRITRERGGLPEALDLRVRSTPLEFAGERFLIFSVADISHEKRRQSLERIFFHDILNLAGGIRGFAEILQDSGEEAAAGFTHRIREAAERIIDEIQAQRTLTAAENQDLQARPEPLEALELLRQVGTLYRYHEVGRERELRLAGDAEPVSLVSDAALLGRVLGNLVKNALEASGPGQTVLTGCRRAGESVEFWVHNQGCIPEEYRLQIFQRSFSTRGEGRGLGTYSIRLLTEDYLGGRVFFSSSPEDGTTFLVRFPLRWSGPERLSRAVTFSSSSRTFPPHPPCP